MMTRNNTESESADVKPSAIVGSNFLWHINSGCFEGKEPGAYALSRTFNRCNRKWQLRLESRAPDLPPQLSLELVSLPIRWSFRAYISYSTLRFKSGTTSYECEHNFINTSVAHEDKISCVLGPLRGDFDLIQCKFDLRYLLPASKRKSSSGPGPTQSDSKRPRRDSSPCNRSLSSTPSYSSFARKLETDADSPADESENSANQAIENESADVEVDDLGSSENEEEESGAPVTSADDDDDEDDSGEQLVTDFCANLGAQSPILSASHFTTLESDASVGVSSVTSIMKRKNLTRSSSSPKVSPPPSKICAEVKPDCKLPGKISNVVHNELNGKNSKIAKLAIEAEKKLTIKTEKPKRNCSKPLVTSFSLSSSRAATMKPEVKPEIEIEIEPDIKPKIRPADTRLTLDLEGLMHDQKFSDTLIVTRTRRRFPAHKAILSARSATFSEMIQQNEKEARKVILLYEIADNVLEELLRFIYTGTVSDIDANTLELFKASDLFKVQGLKDMCIERLSNYLSVDNAADFLVIADKDNYLSLKSQALEYINRNAAEVISTGGFQRMAKFNPNLVTELYCMLVKGTEKTYTGQPSKNRTM